MSPTDCVILVPAERAIEPGCDASLRELAKRGYPVRRLFGCPDIDVARSRLATDALRDGFNELMWIDSDIVFAAEDVEVLRSRQLPFICGLYPKKGLDGFACQFLPDTNTITLGVEGKPLEILACGFGFTLVRREVFETVRIQKQLPLCNRRSGAALVPFFMPMVTETHRAAYLPEDFAFCERARSCGIRIVADPTLRLWHVGSTGLTWEDLGRQPTK